MTFHFFIFSHFPVSLKQVLVFKSKQRFPEKSKIERTSYTKICDFLPLSDYKFYFLLTGKYNFSTFK
jgi:hypothetical protein